MGAADNSDYIGFKELGVFQVVKPMPGIKVLDALKVLNQRGPQKICEMQGLSMLKWGSAGLLERNKLQRN